MLIIKGARPWRWTLTHGASLSWLNLSEVEVHKVCSGWGGGDPPPVL